jgi:hypothetical protein
MSLMAFYVVDANFEAGNWRLSSDAMVPGAVPGSTFHADYFEAWSPTVRDTWLQYCTNGHLQCAGGDLGNGTRIKGMVVPNTSGLVALNSIPTTGSSATADTTTTTVTTTTMTVPIVMSPTPVTTGTTTGTTNGGTTTGTTTGGTTTGTTGGTTTGTSGGTTSTGGSSGATCKGKGKKCTA